MQGANRIQTTTKDERGRPFVISRGFGLSGTLRASEIDPRRVSEGIPPPAGVTVVALREVIDQAETLYELYSQGRADVPSQVPVTGWTSDEWRRETLDHPLLDVMPASSRWRTARRAAALGITRIRTGDDVDIQPMLAVNHKLGYTPTILIETFAKSLFA